MPGTVGITLKVVENGGSTELNWFRGIQGHTSCVYRGLIVSGTPWSYDLAPLGAQVPGTDTLEATLPPLGEVFYYLVAATNVCGVSQVGLDSLGQPIPNNAICAAPAVDYDADGVPDPADNCPLVTNVGLSDADGDFVGDACDNCPLVHNPDQNDANLDGTGDACAP